MKNSVQRIRTSHVGRLPVPSGSEEIALVAAQVVPVVADVVKREVEIGLDCIGDGEYRSGLDVDQQMTGLGTRKRSRKLTRVRPTFGLGNAHSPLRVNTSTCIANRRPPI
jgi:hypothetical protein